MIRGNFFFISLALLAVMSCSSNSSIPIRESRISFQAPLPDNTLAGSIQIHFQVPNYPANQLRINGSQGSARFSRQTANSNPETVYVAEELIDLFADIGGATALIVDGQAGNLCVRIFSVDSLLEIMRSTACERFSPPSPTPTESPSPTPTESPSPTPTGSPSPTPTGSPSPTPTGSPSPTPTGVRPIEVSLSVVPPQVFRGSAVAISGNVFTANGLRSQNAFQLRVTSPVGSSQTFNYSATQLGCRAGDITCAFSRSIAVPTFFNTGNYILTLTVFDSNNQSASDSKNLRVL